ncbi:MAG: T9SS type A sorting domain-containing protein [Bacteroidota bacterium]
MKKVFLRSIIFLFPLLVQPIYAQLNYLVSGTSNDSGIYTDLGTNGSAITTTNFDDDNSAPQNIGFNFSYNGSIFTQFVLNTNGFIKLGNTDPSIPDLFYTNGSSNLGGVFNSSLTPDANILCVFNHDLEAGTSTPEYRVYTNGTPGSRICIIQFKNVRDKTTSPAVQFDNMEFQIKLYETTNTIEFVYGTWDPSANTSATKTAAVGLKGTDNSNAHLLVINKPSILSWNAANSLAGNYTGTNAFKFGNPSTRPGPDAGRTLRFVQALPNDAIVNLYTLGSIPNPYGSPRIDSSIVRNIGMNTLTNISVGLNITGANTFTDVITISSLAPGASATIGFAAYTPANLGTNTVSVTLSNDDNNNNNTDAYSQVVNNTVFSYADANRATDGLGGNLPSYFATKYTITGTTDVIGANIYLANNATSIGKTVYAILFDNAGAKLDSSAALVITASDTGQYYNFQFPLTPTISNSSFFVGLAQPTVATNYYPLGYQSEKAPVRLGAYFITTMLAAPNFTDLGGINSYNPYRLMIQAVISNTIGILENVSENQITAYPNPFSSSITFTIQADYKDLIFNLYDVTGKSVRTIKNINTDVFKLERNELQSGIYFYSISNSEKILSSGKLIVE